MGRLKSVYHDAVISEINVAQVSRLSSLTNDTTSTGSVLVADNVITRMSTTGE